MAVRFAMDLNGVALGMWEVARLLQQPKTQDEGRRKLDRLRHRLGEFKKQPVMSDSLSIFFQGKFDPEIYSSLLDCLENKDPVVVLPKIKSLAEQTRGYLDESRRTKTDLRRAF